MKIERGMTFRCPRGIKYVIANTFMEKDDEVVTYRHWIKHKKRWEFVTEFKSLFLIGFDYGWKWE